MKNHTTVLIILFTWIAEKILHPSYTTVSVLVVKCKLKYISRPLGRSDTSFSRFTGEKSTFFHNYERKKNYWCHF